MMREIAIFVLALTSPLLLHAENQPILTMNNPEETSELTKIQVFTALVGGEGLVNLYGEDNKHIGSIAQWSELHEGGFFKPNIRVHKAFLNVVKPGLKTIHVDILGRAKQLLELVYLASPLNPLEIVVDRANSKITSISPIKNPKLIHIPTQSIDGVETFDLDYKSPFDQEYIEIDSSRKTTELTRYENSNPIRYGANTHDVKIYLKKIGTRTGPSWGTSHWVHTYTLEVFDYYNRSRNFRLPLTETEYNSLMKKVANNINFGHPVYVTIDPFKKVILFNNGYQLSKGLMLGDPDSTNDANGSVGNSLCAKQLNLF